MSQIDRIVTVLAKNTETPGLTAAMIAKRAGVPKQNVAKRVADLRSEGFAIYTNYRMRNGARKSYYRLAQ